MPTNSQTQPSARTKELEEKLLRLPSVVRNAIAAADVKKRLQGLATTHKLHVDQWETLEYEVMRTILGEQPPENLSGNIQSGVKLSEEIAQALALDVSLSIFEPIREQLERELEHPDAKAAAVSGVDAARTQILSSEDKPAAPTAPAVLPATPPSEPPTGKIARAPVSESYKAGETSTARKSVHDDPYREPPA